MSIVLAYLDYKSADIALREKVSFTEAKTREVIRDIRQNNDISGVVLLSTCNRTEIYISSHNMEKINPAEILCIPAGITDKETVASFKIKYNEEAIMHLMEVACGLQSMVMGEDQIITQVKNAALIAREERTSDPVLETVFRLSATAAKKVKTQVKIRLVPSSAAESAIDFLGDRYDLKDKNVLVIGNGEIGRLCCRKLIASGACVTITLRKYKHGETAVPYGCNTVPYDERAHFLSRADAVVSATSSPHYTITYDMVEKLQKKPVYFVDLALPRDIEPRLADMDAIKCWNLDDICGDTTKINEAEILKIKEIINDYCTKFEEWYTIHRILKLKGASIETIRCGTRSR